MQAKKKLLKNKIIIDTNFFFFLPIKIAPFLGGLPDLLLTYVSIYFGLFILANYYINKTWDYSGVAKQKGDGVSTFCVGSLITF